MAETRQYEPQKRARRRALQALYQWQITGQSPEEIIGQFLEVQDFSNVDTGLFKHLVAGVIGDKALLDTSLEPFLDRPMEHLDIMELVILRLGAYQLLEFPELPFQVVLDESIELAKRFGSSRGHVYINAVLDKSVLHLRPKLPADN